METLPVSIVTEVRDLIDRTSDGRGFLPLVLTGGMEHYKLLASVRTIFFYHCGFFFLKDSKTEILRSADGGLPAPASLREDIQ